MNKLMIALFGATVLVLSGCAGTTQVASTPAKPALSADAQAALTQAKADVASAKKQKALWTTAESALKTAEEAAKTADNAVVIKNAKSASTLAQLGIAQTRLPTTDQFK